jgi:uncharacterized protein YecT (DUF1311 family)
MTIGKNLTALALTMILSLFVWIPPAGAEERTHPIDQWVEEALAADDSTAGMRETYAEGLKRWDGELNAQYRLLAQKLRPEAMEVLKASQRLWIKYRDAEEKAAQALGHELYEVNEGGTIWGVLTAERVMQITRARARELEGYVRLLTGISDEP